jgi:hypothetical protein
MQTFGLKTAQFHKNASAELIAAVTGYIIQIYGICMTAAAAQAGFKLQTDYGGTPVDIGPAWTMAQGVPITLLPNDQPLFESASGKNIGVVITTAAYVDGQIWYRLVKA